MKNCQIIEVNRLVTTSGLTEKVLVCYCGTTGCQNILTYSYPLPKDFSAAKKISLVPPELDCDCEYETVLKDGSMCRKCEKRYYAAIYGSLALKKPAKKRNKKPNPTP